MYFFPSFFCFWQESPEIVFLWEKKKDIPVTSPEVKYLGERMGQTSRLNPPNSSEVKCLGQRMFNNFCSNISAKTDDLYNAQLTIGTTNYSSGKENVPPKRVINPGPYLVSPYNNHVKTLIKPNELRIYETITTICNDSDFRE